MSLSEQECIAVAERVWGAEPIDCGTLTVWKLPENRWAKSEIVHMVSSPDGMMRTEGAMAAMGWEWIIQTHGHGWHAFVHRFPKHGIGEGDQPTAVHRAALAAMEASS